MKLLQKYLLEKGLDCAIFATYEKVNPNLFYLTEYVGAGFLVVFANGRLMLHVPSRDLSLAKKVKGVTVSSGKKLSEVLSSNGISVKKAGIDFSNISVLDFNNLKEKLKCDVKASDDSLSISKTMDSQSFCDFVDLTEFMNGLRMVKSKEEVVKIQEACRITDLIITKFVNNFKTFKTEKEAGAFLVYEATKLAEGVSFEPIVASGANAAIPHHKSLDVMNNGFCVVDFGVKYKGYCSDVTRTFYVGKPSVAEEKIYYDLLEAQKKAIGLVKPGVVISDLCIDAEKDLKQKLIHSLGHGLGIEVHEMPYVSTDNKTTLIEGMVITIEPGEYIEGKYGIRIEDDVLVTSSGCEVLSKFRKELIIIK